MDYACLICSQTFQLKSQSKPFGAKILDSAYSEMKREILEDRTPNLYVMEYDRPSWSVRTIFLFRTSLLLYPLSNRANRWRRRPVVPDG